MSGWKNDLMAKLKEKKSTPKENCSKYKNKINC